VADFPYKVPKSSTDTSPKASKKTRKTERSHRRNPSETLLTPSQAVVSLPSAPGTPRKPSRHISESEEPSATPPSNVERFDESSKAEESLRRVQDQSQQLTSLSIQDILDKPEYTYDEDDLFPPYTPPTLPSPSNLTMAGTITSPPKIPTEEDIEQGRAIVIKPGVSKWITQLDNDDLKTLAKFQFYVNSEVAKTKKELQNTKETNEKLGKDLTSSQWALAAAKKTSSELPFRVKPMKKKGKDKGEEGTDYHPPGDFGEDPDGSEDDEDPSGPSGPSGPPGGGPPDNDGPGGPGGPGSGFFQDFQGPTERMQLKIPMPERFDGDKDKLDKFMREVINWFIFQPRNFPNDKVKILWTLNLIAGPKVDHWVNRLDLAIKQDQFDYPDYCQTWDEFKQILKDKFEDRNKKTVAQHKIQSIQQGSKTVDEYITDFKLLAEESFFDENALLIFFIRGLRNSIYNASTHYKPVTTYNGWMKLAKRIELDNFAREQIHSARGDKHHGFSKPPPPPQQQSRPIPPRPSQFTPRNQFGQYQQRPPQQFQRPMQKPMQQTPNPLYRKPPSSFPPPRPAPPPPNREPKGYGPMDVDRMRTVKCYKCQQMGHFARDCKVKQINELSEEARNIILEKHLKTDKEVPIQRVRAVTVEEIPDEDSPDYVPDYEQNQYDQDYQEDNLYMEHEDQEQLEEDFQ